MALGPGVPEHERGADEVVSGGPEGGALTGAVPPPAQVEIPGVIAPCGHVLARPDPRPASFLAQCPDHGRTWRFTAEHGGLSWKAEPA